MSVQAQVNKPAPHERAEYWGSVYAMALCSFVLVAAEFMPVSLLTPMAAALGLTEGQAGQTVSICSIAALVSSLAIRKITGGMDRRVVLICLTALLVLSGPLVAFAPSFGVLLLGRILVGAALGGFWSLSAATAMRLVSSKSVPKALAVISAGTAIAGTVAAPMGSFLGSIIGWRGAFFSIIPLALTALIWQIKTLPSLPSHPQSTKVGIVGLLRRPAVTIGYIGAMAFFAGQYSMFTYLRPFLEQVTHADVEAVSLNLLVIGAFGFVGTLAVGRLIGPRLHLTISAFALTMALATVGLAAFGATAAFVGALLGIWGFCATSAQVSWWAWVTKAASDDAEAGGGLLVAVAQVGITTGAVLGGLAYDGSGPIAIAAGSAAMLVLAALLATVSGRIGRRAYAHPTVS